MVDRSAKMFVMGQVVALYDIMTLKQKISFAEPYVFCAVEDYLDNHAEGLNDISPVPGCETITLTCADLTATVDKRALLYDLRERMFENMIDMEIVDVASELLQAKTYFK